MQYLGLALVLSWNYSLWSVAPSFSGPNEMSPQLVASWLVAVFTSGIAPLVLAWRFDRSGRFPIRPWLIWTMAITGAAATVILIRVGRDSQFPWLTHPSALVVGVTGSVLWLMWGQRLADVAADFALTRVAPTFSGALLVSLGLAVLSPTVLDPAVVAVQPLLSGLLLQLSMRRQPHVEGPHLLPLKARVEARRPMLTIAAIAFFASFACYFTVAITPIYDPVTAVDNFGLGVPMGAALLLVVAGLSTVLTGGRSEFRVFPWLILLTVVACVAYITDWELHSFAFVLALATSTLFEILLTIYMGVLSRRGYSAPATAFASSRSAMRLGIGFASGLAVIYAKVPGTPAVLVPATFAVLAAVSVGLLITVVRQEYAIEALTRPPQAESDLEAMVTSVANEFGLSDREREIMTLIGQGYSAGTVATKLVISPYTVNSHVQHIYAKLGIHKRSELIAYLRRDA